MKTTSVTRNDDDSFSSACPENGVPITVRIPTHLRVEIYEQLYFVYDEKKQIFRSPPSRGRRNLKVRSSQIKTEKVVFVDVKRPAAGGLDYNLKFDHNAQSITQYESFVFDRTLRDSANLAAALSPGIGPQDGGTDPTMDSGFSNTGLPESQLAAKRSQQFTDRVPKFLDGSAVNDDELFIRDRVVAVKIFDINADDFEHQLQGFLEHHVNGCHSCGQTSSCHLPNSDRIAPAPLGDQHGQHHLPHAESDQ